MTIRIYKWCNKTKCYQVLEHSSCIASKFKVTIRILFVFGRIIVLIIHIVPNSKEPLFGTALITLELFSAA